MHKELYQFNFEVYNSLSELNDEDSKLLKSAQEAAFISYAPYSGFHVGAAARLINGEIITGGNQEKCFFSCRALCRRSSNGNGVGKISGCWYRYACCKLLFNKN